MILNDIINLRPPKSKAFAYIVNGVAAACFLAYAAISSEGSFVDFGDLFAAIIVAVLFAIIGACANSGNRGGILGALTMLMGYFLVMWTYNGFFISTEWLIAEDIQWVIYDIAYALTALSFAIGSFAYIASKFIGYHKPTMKKVAMVAFIISFICLLAMTISYICTGFVSDYIEYIFQYVGYTLVPVAVIASAALAETITD